MTAAAAFAGFGWLIPIGVVTLVAVMADGIIRSLRGK